MISCCLIRLNVAKEKMHPIVKLIKRKQVCIDSEERSTYDSMARQSTATQAAVDDEDNISLKILSEPQCGIQITADVVFIHGLHGK